MRFCVCWHKSENIFHFSFAIFIDSEPPESWLARDLETTSNQIGNEK
jgi:hypothetical protein